MTDDTIGQLLINLRDTIRLNRRRSLNEAAMCDELLEGVDAAINAHNKGMERSTAITAGEETTS